MKRLVGVGVLALSLSTANIANAESSQDSALELKLGSYHPNIDSEPGLTSKPYAEYFNNGDILLFEAEYDYQFFHTFGSLALGVSAGYGEIYGHGQFAKGQGATGVSGDLTALKMYPVHLLLVYRFDVLNERWHIPLVPFAKLGFDTNLYQISNGSGGQNVDSDGKKGEGLVYGWEGDLGLAFVLDILDPDLARDFDLDVGINHSYLFGEWSYASINDFGTGGFVFSDSFFKFGLAVEF